MNSNPFGPNIGGTAVGGPVGHVGLGSMPQAQANGRNDVMAPRNSRLDVLFNLCEDVAIKSSNLEGRVRNVADRIVGSDDAEKDPPGTPISSTALGRVEDIIRASIQHLERLNRQVMRLEQL